MMSEIFYFNDYECIDYLINNLEVNDVLEISYKNLYLPGIVLSVDIEYNLVVNLKLMGDLLNQETSINFNKIVDDLIEVKHGKNDETWVIVMK